MSDKKSFEFGDWTLNDILEYNGEKRYFCIPSYQRGYAWGQRQLKEFWDDLQGIGTEGVEDKHYTGAITVKKIESRGDEATDIPTDYVGYDVVDGQQRLTTMAILLAVVAEKDNNPFLLRCSDNTYACLFAYRRDNPDAKCLATILLGEDCGETPQNNHQRNLLDARLFFADKINGFNEESKKKLIGKVRDNLLFDFKKIGEHFKEGIVFETMNNRGKPLTLLEKLKNRLMYLTTTIPGLQGNGVNALKNEINDCWGNIYRNLASHTWHELDEDELVVAHLSCYRKPLKNTYKREDAEMRLFKMFCADPTHYYVSERHELLVADDDDEAMQQQDMRRPVEQPVNAEKIRNYIRDLEKFSQAWADVNCDSDSAAGHCRLLSGLMEVKMLLATVQLKIVEGQRTNVFKKIEKLLFKRTVKKEVANDSAFSTWARNLYCGELVKPSDRIDCTQLETEIDNLLHPAQNDTKHRLGLNDLVSWFEGRMGDIKNDNGFYGWSGIKYFLYSMEGTDGLGWELFDDVTTEHILPQSIVGEEHKAPSYGGWVNVVRQFADESNDRPLETRAMYLKRRGIMVNTLGNLTLLRQGDNSRVSNNPWESYQSVEQGEHAHDRIIGKRKYYLSVREPEIRGGEALETSSAGAYEVAQYNESWGAFQIRERGRKLFRELAKMLGVVEDGAQVSDDQADRALGFTQPCFDNVDFKQMETPAEPLRDEAAIAQIARRIRNERERNNRRPLGADSNDAEIYSRFWEGMQRWCNNNDNSDFYLALKNASKHNDSRWFENGECGELPVTLFIDLRKQSPATDIKEPVVVIGVYCKGSDGVRDREMVLDACWPTFKDKPKDFAKELKVDGADGKYKKNPNSKAARICFAIKCGWSGTVDDNTYRRIVEVCKRVKAKMQEKGFIPK